MLFVRCIFAVATMMAVFSGPAHGAIVYKDISNQAGFKGNGVAGTAGNGIVFLSPVYTVGLGAAVDFGTAFLQPDEVDFRGNCQFFDNCSSAGRFLFLFTKNGSGGLTDAPFELEADSTMVLCPGPSFVCAPIVIPLRFTLPADSDGIQFGFEGSSLTITSPVPEPSTWAMLLVGFAGMCVFSYRRRSRRPTDSGSPQAPAQQY